jgi:hypothetical protein
MSSRTIIRLLFCHVVIAELGWVLDRYATICCRDDLLNRSSTYLQNTQQQRQ